MFLWGPPANSAALRAWANAMSSGTVSLEGLRFTA